MALAVECGAAAPFTARRLMHMTSHGYTRASLYAQPPKLGARKMTRRPLQPVSIAQARSDPFGIQPALRRGGYSCPSHPHAYAHLAAEPDGVAARAEARAASSPAVGRVMLHEIHLRRSRGGRPQALHGFAEI